VTAVPETTDPDPLADVAERFAADVAEHEMTIFRDDGLYRHLRFVRTAVNEKTGKPELSSLYWFDLITWPGHLAIDGDMDGFMFARTEDMFEFFRGKRINPSYWAEKRRGPVEVRKYSEDKFRGIVAGHISEGDEKHPSLAQEWPGLAEAVEREIFTGAPVHYEQGARDALDNFTFGDKHEGECLCGEKREFPEYEDARLWLAAHSAEKGLGHRSQRIGLIEGFRFTDVWEWDFSDYTYPFLWCLHAIQWGIGQYDLSKAPAPAAAALAPAAEEPRS
jgi:hypothetical protein